MGSAGQIKQPADLDRLMRGEHSCPHAILGSHPVADGAWTGVVIRTFDPHAGEADVLRGGPDGEAIPMQRTREEGLFEAAFEGEPDVFTYVLRLRDEHGERVVEDPYRFLPTLGDVDIHLCGEGRHRRLHEQIGSHVIEHGGVLGTAFAVWAPNARRVSVIGDWNRWDGRVHPMRTLGESGIWEIFLPGLMDGCCYKFEIKTRTGELLWKSDPYARRMEAPPRTASIVTAPSTHEWGDATWMDARRESDLVKRPLSIYEVHLGSWRRPDGKMPTFREIAPDLVAHVTDYGFTHIELMPVMEHPFRGSWGYQVTGYFAPSRRHGEPDDLRALIDACHQAGIGVILDWVPAHFPRDPHGLARFDGTGLYEHVDPRQGEHPDWGTLVFNYGRTEVRNFLIANALYWLDSFHADGLRIDAVSSMLHLDYSRGPGEWIPNVYGGNENLDAVSFLSELNEIVHGSYPGTLMIAEESTAWPRVSHPTYLGGLGFTYKWNMGWMHDALRYFARDPVHRKFHHEDLTFPLVYAFTENFILPLSHDEVVHGKGSLLGKMNGDDWQKAANLRSLYAYMMTTPGKKLLFMGSEVAPWREWNHDDQIEWDLREHEPHRGVGACLRDLLHLYRRSPELWELDHTGEGFSWIDFRDRDSSIIAYLRRGEDPDRHVITVLNLTPEPRDAYVLGVPSAGSYRELLNTDAEIYGGSNMGNLGKVVTEPDPSHGLPHRVRLTLPPLSALVLGPA
jgi:1,4-alpha-glucan branching enzyme